jgi:ubiquinone/menaquinone biosynthesis C-methylase UbiE
VTAQFDWNSLTSVAENYERNLVPIVFAPWADELVATAALRPGDRVLDVACGTGIVARIAARKLGGTGSVAGLDASLPMITVARVAATAEGIDVDWREASAVALPFPEASFDVVFCQSGLQFFPDRPASLREMHRVLKPAGRLILSVWGPIERSRGFAVAADALARHIGPEAALPITSGAFGLSDADELRALVTDANFKDITVRAAIKTLRYPSPVEFILRHITGSPLGNAVEQAGESARTAMLAEIESRLASAVDEGGLAFSIEANIVIART